MDRSQLNKILLLVEQLTQLLDQEQEQEVEHGHTSGGLAFGGADLLSCGSTRDMLERANLRVALLGQFREPVKQGGSPVSLKTKPLRFRSGLGFQPGAVSFCVVTPAE